MGNAPGRLREGGRLHRRVGLWGCKGLDSLLIPISHPPHSRVFLLSLPPYFPKTVGAKPTEYKMARKYVGPLGSIFRVF